jgi:DNA-binding PucR family transcriptional regulator
MAEPEWTPAARLVERELSRLDLITFETVTRIRDELPDFLLVPMTEHVGSVHEQLRRRLEAFRERRAWDPGDLDQAVRLAQRRARQGIPVDTLISAFHVGDRELWRNLSREPGSAAPLLPELTSLMLESMQAVSTTLASAHSRETRERDRVHISVSQRFIELLLARDFGAELSRLAQYLGLDEGSEHLAVAFVAGDDDQTRREDSVLRHLEELDPIHARIAETYVVLLHGTDAASHARAAIDSAREHVRAGIGGVKQGLEGAATSLLQARASLAISSPTAPVRIFSDDWHLCGFASTSTLLEPEARDAIDVARDHSNLRETVQAYAAASMSKVACARASHLHPNTVTYRLDRWAALTGWDPRDFVGLSKSIAACMLAELR